MKIILQTYEDHAEVVIRQDGINLHVFTFDDKKQARAFITGFTTGRTVANVLIQSMPMDYTTENC